MEGKNILAEVQWITEVKEDQQSMKYWKLLEKEYENKAFYSVKEVQGK